MNDRYLLLRLVVGVLTLTVVHQLLHGSTAVTAAEVKPEKVKKETVKQEKVKPVTRNKLQEALERMDELKTQLAKYIKDVDRLAKENDDLRKTVRRLRTSNDTADNEAEQAAEQSEDYFKKESSRLALELTELKRFERRTDAELKDCKADLVRLRKQLVDQQEKSASSPGKPTTQPETETCLGGSADERPSCLRKTVIELDDKLSNCEDTLQAVRDRSDSDQRDLKRVRRDYEALQRSSQNCSEELKDCENSRGYLDFLKRGYEVVVPELETDVKRAKDDREKCEADAKEALKGMSTYRLYLAVSAVVIFVVVSVKLYHVIAETWRQRTELARAAEKLEKKGKQRDGRRSTKPNSKTN